LNRLREDNMTMYNVMEFSAENDMVAREWTNGFALTREMADLLLAAEGGSSAIPAAFLTMLSRHLDTFVIKKFGPATAEELRNSAMMACNGRLSTEILDAWCLMEGINPGSLADICIAGIFVALIEGWEWDY
ncbi:MAG: triphosphoribosyl-dephospho-CoA synthase, partial [Methanocorpusculum sp.]|nr:triphosphoribosyl-dephospho-CoA synthase [Methanocorpusculum sp.]